VDQETVLAVAERATVTLANDNAPGQLVLAGPSEDLGRAAELLVAEGARVVLLDVAGAFHSPAMAPAAQPLRDVLDHVNVRNPIVPVISNVTARPYRAPGEIRRLLVEQLTGRVRLRESLEWAWRHGVREAVDLGPGRVVERLALKTFAHLDRLEPALNG
jgi:[acyl-carrier-protein] S-malonyltransferase